MGTITSREACVDHVIGSAYQVVRYVAANMQSIIDVSDAMPQLELWMPSIASVLAAMPTISNINTNLPVIANVNSNLTTLSNINANMAALLNINSNMTALLAIPGVIQAQDFKNSVAVTTTANIALTGLQTIDGYSVPVGARVLVKNQTAPAENGIYVAATGAWARSSDGAAGMLSTGCQVSVDRGTVSAGKQFRLATLGTITVGTTAQSWVEMSSASNVVGQEDDGTPLTVLAPHELQFDNQHFSLTAVAQGVAIALSTEILDAIAAGGGGGGSGETNTASNLGTGVGLYAAKVGADLRFKSLVAGSNITFDVTSDSITVNATGGGSGGIDVSAVDSLGSSDTITDVQTLAFDPDEFFYDGDALGLGIHLAPGALGAINGVGGATGTGASGHQIFKDKSGTDLRFKTLVAGTNISIVPDVDNNSLTINSTGGGGGGSLLVEGSDTDSADVSENVSQMYFAPPFRTDWDPTDGGWMSLSLDMTYMSKRIFVAASDSEGVPIESVYSGGLAFNPFQFTVDFGPDGQAVVSATGGGGGGGVPEAPNDGKQYVRADLGWAEYKFNQGSMINMGTISLVSPSASEDNRMKFRGLVENVVEGNKDILITPVISGGSPDLNDLQFALNSAYRSKWDGYYESSPFWNERIALGGDCNIDSSITTTISAFTANTVFAYPFYVPIGGTVLDSLGLIFDNTTRPASGNLELSIAKMSGNFMTILAYKSFAWSTLGATPDITPNITLTDPGVYVAFLRTTSNASTWKAARKVNATPSLRMGTDPASKVLMDTLQPRWSIAWKFTSVDPLVVDWTISYETLDNTGVTTAPYAELITAFLGG